MGKEIKFKVTLDNGQVIEQTAKSLDDLAIAQKQAQAALSKTDINTKEYKTLAKELKDVEKAQEKATMRAQGLIESLANIEGPIGLVGKGFQGLSKAGTAFAANPVGATITAIGVVLGVLAKALGNTEKGMQALNKITAVFGEIIDPILGLVEDIAAALAEGLAFALEKAAEAMSFFGIEAGEAAKAAGKLSEAEMKLEQENQKAAVTRAKTNKDLAETREILSDSNATYAQRVEALKKVQKAENEQSALEVKNAKETLRIAREKYKMHDDDLQLREKMRQAEIALAGVEQDAAAKGRLLNKQQAALDKEAQAAADARAKESAAKSKARSDAALALQKEALKSTKQAEDEAYLLSIKDEAVRAQEALKIQQRNQDAELQLKIDGLEKISKRTKAENEALAALKKQQDAEDIAQVAQTEALITKQKEDAEKKRIEDEKKAADEAKAIAEKGYADRQKAIDNDYKQQETKLIESGLTLDEIKKQQDAADLARLEAKIAAAKAAGELGAADVINLELELANKKAQIADADLKKTEEDEKKKAEVRMQTFNGVIQAASAVTNAIAAIQEAQMQKELKGAGDNLAKQEEIKKKYFEKQKKVQIANAIIGTIQGAVQAFTSLASIPVVGPVLGGIAAAAALVAGYANVQKIKDTQYEGAGAGGSGGGGGAGAGAAPPPPPPSMFAEGGLVTGPGTAVSDSIPARLSNGESVINANSTAMFGGLLSAINEMGGGKKFAEGGIGGSMEAPIVKTYVVASDVTSQQEADFQIQQIARL